MNLNSTSFNEMEAELTALRCQCDRFRQRYLAIKASSRQQRIRSRQLFAACVVKLEEREAEIEQIRCDHDEDLKRINVALVSLNDNMVKEKSRLESIILDKNTALASLNAELDRLRSDNNMKIISTKVKRLTEDRQMETPSSSSEEPSPQSSFQVSYSKTNECGSNVKPPIPSRDGINRKIISQKINNDYLAKDFSSKLDLTSVGAVSPTSGGDEGFCSSHEHETSSTSTKSPKNYNCYLEDAGLGQNSLVLSPPPPPLQPPATRHPYFATNHRGIRKLSDIKHRRSRLHSTSNLSVLEEHQVSSNGSVTTVTYWSEPGYV